MGIIAIINNLIFFYSLNCVKASRLKKFVKVNSRKMSVTRLIFMGYFKFAVFILQALLVTSCSSTSCREWEFQDIVTQTPCFNGSRLILAPDSEYSYLELELLRTPSGDRLYVNLLFLQAPALKNDPSRTTLIIQFEEEEPWIVHPYVLEGRQRLLLPGDVADFIIQSLLDKKEFTIQIGRNKIHVVTAGFEKALKKFLRSN